MAEEPDRLKEEIDTTRSDLARNVDLLADRTIPTRVARRRWAGVKDSVRGVTDKVMGSTSEGAHATRSGVRSATDSVQSAASQAGEKASNVASSVADSVRQAPQTVTRQAQGNPLAAGMIAFGVGLLAASLIPATDAERRAGQQLKDNAGDLIEPVREPLTQAAQELKEDLSGSVRDAAQQVKGTAQDAAQTTADQARSSAQDAKHQAKQAASNATG